MITMEDQLLTVEEVAQKIRVTPYTVRKYLRQETIPAIKLDDGTWLVKESDVTNFLRKRMYQRQEES